MKKLNQKERLIEYYCDRCNKKFAENKPGEKPDVADLSVKRGTGFMAPTVKQGSVSFHHKDLCGSCTTAFSKWMTQKKAQ